MKNFIQPGNTVTVTAPAGGVKSGDGVLPYAGSSLFGVAATDAAEGSPVELALVGVYDLPRDSGATFTPGSPVYWEAAEKRATDEGIENPVIGTALEVSATTVRVRLFPHPLNLINIVEFAALAGRVAALENA